jgi:hypothetical protein
MIIIKNSIAAGLASICVLGSAAAADVTGPEIFASLNGRAIDLPVE